MKFYNFIFLFTILVNILQNKLGDADSSIENVYIDVMIQHYMAMESTLWSEINKNTTNDLVSRIRSEHNDFFSREPMASVLSDEHISKFKKYLSLSVFESYVRDGQKSISNVISSEFNSALTNDLFEEIKKDTESLNCDNRSTQLIESSSQNVFMFYLMFISLMLSSYANEQRGHMMQATKHGVVGHDYKILRNKFNFHYEKIGQIARNQIKDSNRDVWMCDLDFYIKEDESIQVTNLLQGYVENEVNLNKEGTCRGSCDDYKFARNYDCASGTFCGDELKNGTKNARCSGTIVDCSFVESDMKICPSLPTNTRRRYDHILFKSGRHMGRKFCGRERYPVESYITLWMTSCSYCFCYCDADTDESDRYFSLKPTLSDISKNKIVTGVGLHKRNGIFSWSITQSTLRSNGRVDQVLQNETNSEHININVDEVFQDFKRTDFGIVEGTDYHKLSWQNRSINLALITVPQGCAITGIRFTVIKEHLNFEIQSTQFDFNKGLLYSTSEWISNKNEKRSILLLDRPEPSHPIHINSEEGRRSIPDFSPNKFIKFRPTDPDKDAGQTTVPFIDTQMVRPKDLTLLSGVALYYKGRPGYGGFIAPKLIVYDMSSYLAN